MTLSQAAGPKSDMISNNQKGSTFNAGQIGKIDDVSMSVNKQIKHLEDQLVLGYDLLQAYKEEADHIRQEIDMMMNVLIEKTEVVQDELHLDTRKDYKMLKGDIKGQRDENEILYKHLKGVVKDTESQRAKVAIFQAKVEELEQHVGILGNDHNDHIMVDTGIQQTTDPEMMFTEEQ